MLSGLQDDAVLAEAFARAPQMLCIVNSRAHARDVFERIRGMDGAVHLTTLMCGMHRREVCGEQSVCSTYARDGATQG